MRKSFLMIIGWMILSCGAAMQIEAQSATATLSGTVTDEQGAIIAGASVKITDRTKAFERTTAANDDGYFIFTQLPPSSYTVNVERSGFAAAHFRHYRASQFAIAR